MVKVSTVMLLELQVVLSLAARRLLQVCDGSFRNVAVELLEFSREPRTLLTVPVDELHQHVEVAKQDS